MEKILDLIGAIFHLLLYTLLHDLTVAEVLRLLHHFSVFVLDFPGGVNL